MRFILLFLISFSAFANYALKTEIESKSIGKVYLKRPKTGDYLKLPKGFHSNYYKIINEMISDIDQPIYEAKSNIISCSAIIDDPATIEIDETKSQEQDCIDKAAIHICDTETGHYMVRAENNSEVYCTKLLGYVQVLSGSKVVVEDAALKNSYEAAKTLQEVMDSAVNAKVKDMDFGRKLYAIVKVSSDVKGLSKGLRKQLKTDLKEIKEDLLDGDICMAKDGVIALTANGTTILQSDIDDIIARIDTYKSCM